ncbi:UDP-N-acetylglucosamine 1-carboxyvinyltransferase, partial [Staphylococcus aureus]|nr:UDP-N-acetylglucosamine 1-carboxyvinyltransferase [Staphylococcus aureus]
CLIIDGLIAEGLTTIYNVKHIYRCYTDFVEHLKALGADIWTETV